MGPMGVSGLNCGDIVSSSDSSSRLVLSRPHPTARHGGSDFAIVWSSRHLVHRVTGGWGLRFAFDFPTANCSDCVVGDKLHPNGKPQSRGQAAAQRLAGVFLGGSWGRSGLDGPLALWQVRCRSANAVRSCSQQSVGGFLGSREGTSQVPLDRGGSLKHHMLACFPLLCH